MSGRVRNVDQAGHVGRRLVRDLGDELREARLRAGLRQTEVARYLDHSQSWVSEVELGMLEAVSVLDLARHAGAVGLKLHARMYPAGPPIRDQAQVALLERLRPRLFPGWRIRLEAPLGIPGDQRAWDMLLWSDATSIGIEAISRLRDVQAQIRAAQLKREHAGVKRLVLLVAATHGNRRALEAAAPLIQASFPLGTRTALKALADGRDPGADALILL